MADKPLTSALPPAHLIEQAVKAALAEDLGDAGDITSSAVISANASASAIVAARAPGVVAGLTLVAVAFRFLDPAAKMSFQANDGDTVEADQSLAHINGRARAMLSAERVALNFLGHLSGIATLTRRYVDAVAGTNAKICCTRKTTPGLRAFEKYAVRCGGAVNHRFGLYDAVMIKDNHIAAAGGVRKALEAVRNHHGHMVKVEIEVDGLAQLDEVLTDPPDVILLDNMSTEDLEDAVKRVGGRAVTEASGGVTLNTVRAIAETGVDLISVGALTHSAPNLDVGLDFVGG